MAVVMVIIMNNFTNYKQFRNMNASYCTTYNGKIISFRSYNTDILYIDGTTTYPYFSFLEYTGTTTQKQVTTFLHSHLIDFIENYEYLIEGYKVALKWARNKGYRGKRVNVTCYPWYMVISLSGNNVFFRVSYSGKTLSNFIKR